MALRAYPGLLNDGPFRTLRGLCFAQQLLNPSTPRDALSQLLFNQLTIQQTGGNIQEQLDNLFICHEQTRPVRVQESFCDCRSDTLVAINEGMRLSQMIGIGRSTCDKVSRFVMMSVLSRRQRRFE